MDEVLVERVEVPLENLVKGNTYYIGPEGYSPFAYIRKINNGLLVRYISCGVKTIQLRESYYEDLYQTYQTQQKENTMTTLYEITKGKKTLFGSKLAVNSAGEWVMEVKGTGEVISVTKELVTEVLPYTVSIKFINSHNTPYHYFATEGQYAVDDLIVVDGGFARVSEVGTTSRKATKWLTGWKVSSEYVASGE